MLWNLGCYKSYPLKMNLVPRFEEKRNKKEVESKDRVDIHLHSSCSVEFFTVILYFLFFGVRVASLSCFFGVVVAKSSLEWFLSFGTRIHWNRKKQYM
jgi:hypothetical protein